MDNVTDEEIEQAYHEMNRDIDTRIDKAEALYSTNKTARQEAWKFYLENYGEK